MSDTATGAADSISSIEAWRAHSLAMARPFSGTLQATIESADEAKVSVLYASQRRDLRDLNTWLGCLRVRPIEILKQSAQEVQVFVSRSVARARAAADGQAEVDAVGEIEAVPLRHLENLRAAIEILEAIAIPEGAQ